MTKTEPTFTAQIYMAGDMAHARQVLRQYCYDVGLCVTIEAVDYIYTGGEEAGFRVGLINYPRFPSSPAGVKEHARALADKLREALCQHSYTIVTPEETFWNSEREHTAEMLRQEVGR